MKRFVDWPKFGVRCIRNRRQEMFAEAPGFRSKLRGVLVQADETLTVMPMLEDRLLQSTMQVIDGHYARLISTSKPDAAGISRSRPPCADSAGDG